jgi:hypothetical protein
MKRLKHSTAIDRTDRRFVLLSGALLAGGLLANCTTRPVPATIPEIRFQGTPPLRLRVAAIDVLDETPAANAGPDFSGVLTTSPEQAMRNWAEDRLAATKTASEIARYRIVQSDVMRKVEDKLSGIKNLFKGAPLETFTIGVAAHLDVLNANGGLIKTVSGKAWGEQSFPLDLELPERKKGVNALVLRVMTDFDREMDAAIRANMVDFLA